MAGTATEEERPAAAGLSLPPRAGWLLATLLGATFLGTGSNNVVNVPLRQITDDLAASVTQAVLAASTAV
ncbi:hypothetical protein ACI79C_10180 [Geodermatophilus sp. SYSU D00697]